MRGWIRNAVLGAGAGALVVAAAPPAGAQDGALTVELRDECDAASFEAAVGEDSCDPRYGGGVTFDELVEELTQDTAQVLRSRDARGWRFSPRSTEIDRSKQVVLRSRGGEAHTFTRVDRFGGGCVDAINDLLGMTAQHPVCSVDGNGNTVPDWVEGIVPPGQEAALGTLPVGTHRFECMIHPWMRAVITVR